MTNVKISIFADRFIIYDTAILLVVDNAAICAIVNDITCSSIVNVIAISTVVNSLLFIVVFSVSSENVRHAFD